MDESPHRNRKDVIQGILQRSHDDKSLSEGTVKSDMPQLHKKAIACFSSWQIALSYAGIVTQKTQLLNDANANDVVQVIRQLCHA